MTSAQIKEIQTKIGVEADECRTFIFSGKEVLVDAVDAPMIEEYRWHVDARGYAYRHRWVEGKDSPVRMHREILKPDDDMMVDHINGNKLDNRRSNLRICTQRQNTFNSVKKRSNKSGFKGVDFRKTKGKFRARIRSEAGREFLGYFNTAEEADLAYQKAAANLHGEFAKIV